VLHQIRQTALERTGRDAANLFGAEVAQLAAELKRGRACRHLGDRRVTRSENGGDALVRPPRRVIAASGRAEVARRVDALQGG